MASRKNKYICARDLAFRLSRRTGYSVRDCSKLIVLLGEILCNSIASGERVKFPHLGTLHCPAKFVRVKLFGDTWTRRVVPVQIRAGTRFKKRLRTAANMKQAIADGV